MGWLELIIGILIVVEIAFTVQVYSNFHYAMKKYRRERTFRPHCVLIVPCKGLDEAFEANIQSFYEQAYAGYRLWFVVESRDDAAYEVLLRLKARHRSRSEASDVRILVAGRTAGCSQKLHNLLFAVHQMPPDVEVLVFADSDACAGPDWLCQVVAPLRKKHIGLASGYRWFVPKDRHPATLALSAMNAKVCQLLGNTRFNLAWGGSMAVRRSDFERLGIEHIWRRALSDDLSLSRAIRRDGLRTRFAPACMIASYQSMRWGRLWEFVRRQFIITRVYAPRLWLFGLAGALLSVVGLWGTLALTIWGQAVGAPYRAEYALAFVVFLSSQIFRAIIRQELAARLLSKDKQALRAARWADWLGFWIWGIVLLVVILSSAVGRTIVWRGIRYRIKSPEDIEILDENKPKRG